MRFWDTHHLRFTLLLGVFCFVLVIGSVTHITHGLSRAPDFTLSDIDGTPFSLSDFRGQAVILDFFATWCSRCVAERTHLKTVQTEFGDTLVILSISIADTDDAVRQFRDEHETDWIYARDTLNLIETYNVTGTSTLYIIDPDGYIRYQHHATIVDATVLTSEIRGLLLYSFTVVTAPRFDEVHVQIDDVDFSTSEGNVSVELNGGPHQIELLDTLITENGLDYHFSSWRGAYVGLDNPIQIILTEDVVLEAQFVAQDTTLPTANAGTDQTIQTDTTFRFNGSQSRDDVGITSYIWTFHDDTPQTLNGVRPTYAFTTPGLYTVTLNVTDTTGNWATDTITITVQSENTPAITDSPYFLLAVVCIAALIVGLVYKQIR